MSTVAALRAPSCTLAQPVTLAGPGIFSALSTTMRLGPAPAGAGLRFHRTDLPEQPAIPASVGHVVARPRHTVLVADPARAAGAGVHTVEHLLSAFSALGITDARVELDGPEIPMLDASALPFAEAVLRAGIAPAGLPAAGAPNARTLAADAPAGPLVVRETARVAEGPASIEVGPTDGPHLDLEYHLDFGPGSPIPAQVARFRLEWGRPDIAAYLREIAPARTFCTLEEAEALRQAGYFSHLCPEDVLVVGPSGPVGTSYRMENEPARHKVLDLIGDLALVGRPVHGRVVARRSGHALNQAMGRTLVGLGC